jgi:hypothetical protein
MRNRDYLFSKASWYEVERNQLAQMKKSIDEMDGNRLLNTAVDDLAAYFVDKFRIDVPSLLTDQIVVDQRETKIDISQDHGRLIHDRSQPFYIPGTEIEVEVPFTGDAEAFKIQPTSGTYSPPQAEVRGSVLIFRINGYDLNPEKVRAEIDRTIKEIQDYLVTLRGNVSGLHAKLPNQAKAAIESRRNKLLSDRNLVGSLGFKMRERPGTQQTFTAPEVRRKITPTLPAASSMPYKPEPALSNTDYEHILNILQNMVHVMERSPSAFATMDEESIRSHFLVQLNGHYEGQATGETFNYEGKTDILIRSDGRNIFIAECKFWSGPKMFTKTIDQLLSYASWRDTKVAIIIFNRSKDFSRVLASIPETARVHPNFKRSLPDSTETVFKYCFSHKDDSNRELFLTVLAFDVPQGT